MSEKIGQVKEKGNSKTLFDELCGEMLDAML